MATLQKQIQTAVGKALKTKEMKAQIAAAVASAFTPEALETSITGEVKSSLAGNITEQTFLTDLKQTNKSILDVLKSGDESSILISDSQQAATPAPNYILFIAIGVVLFLIVKKKVRL